MTTLSDNFKDAVFRRVFAARTVARRIAHRIKVLRESQSLSQGELAQKVGTSQSVLSRLERPDYGSYTLRTLQQIADACDVVLWVDFISHKEFLRRIKSEDSWKVVPSYRADHQSAPLDRSANLIGHARPSPAMADASGEGGAVLQFRHVERRGVEGYPHLTDDLAGATTSSGGTAVIDRDAA